MQTIQAVGAKKSVFQRQIPTIVGLVVLVVGLIAGAFLMAGGPIEFSPRATPQTTPKNVKISNVTDSGFSVSFLTDEQTTGFVKYGTSADELKIQAGDDRDQLSGSVGKFGMHHITVRGLDPGKAYFFTLGTASGSAFDDNGKPFTVTTAKRAGTPTAAKTIYGTITLESGGPADGAVVYVSLPGVGEQSSLVKSSGSWAIPLSNARTADGSGYATIQDTDQLTITVQGVLATQTLQTQVPVSGAQPVPTLAFGKDGAVVSAAPTATPEATPETITNVDTTRPSTTQSVGGLTNLVSTSSQSGSLSTSSSTPSATATSSARSNALASQTSTTSQATSSGMVNLSVATIQEVTTGQPVIKGVAAPNVRVKIQVNSETQINYELIADANGGFTLDISKLENDPTLEPGEHTVTYTYTDPQTGREVSKTQTFYVKGSTASATPTPTPSAQQLALANTTSSTSTRSSTTTGTGGTTPFGSGNPYPITGTSSSSTSTSSTRTSTSSSRTSLPSTASGIPRSGNVETTLALIIGGLFFIAAGTWSYWAAQEIEAV